MPETIAGYRLDRRLASGRWGTLFAGGGSDSDALVLIGIEGPSDRFDRDARAARALSHPTLAQIREHGVEQGPYLVYEALDAATLESILELEGALEARRAARLMVQVLQALEHAHDAGLSHGNIEPATVLVRDGDRASVIALGLSTDADPREDIRMAGTLLGTMLGPSPMPRLADVVAGAEAGTGVYATARGMRRVLEEIRVEIAPRDIAEAEIEDQRESTVWPIPGTRYDPTRLGRRVIAAIVAVVIVAGAAFLWRITERAEELREERRTSPSPEATTSAGNLRAVAGVSSAESIRVRGTLAEPVQHGSRRGSEIGSPADLSGHRRPDEFLRRSIMHTSRG